MNQLVRRWRRHHNRASNKPRGLDSVALGDEGKILLPEELGMPIQHELFPGHFDSVIRLIKRSDLGRVEVLKTAVAEAMKRLKVRPNLKKAVDGIPDGSDQGNIGTLINWFATIKSKETKYQKAIEQLVAIDATAARRLAGQ